MLMIILVYKMMNKYLRNSLLQRLFYLNNGQPKKKLIIKKYLNILFKFTKKIYFLMNNLMEVNLITLIKVKFQIF